MICCLLFINGFFGLFCTLSFVPGGHCSFGLPNFVQMHLI